jgi:chromosome segregation ATPase
MELPTLDTCCTNCEVVARLCAIRNRLIQERDQLKAQLSVAKNNRANWELTARNWQDTANALQKQLDEARKALAALHSTGDEMADLLAICRDDTDTSVCLISAWGIKETKHKAAIDAAKGGGK